MENPTRAAHRQKMLNLIEEWDQSGISQQEFCNQRGIRYSCFQYWRKCYPGSGDDFIALNGFSGGINQIEITYPNGVTLRMPSQTSTSQLLRLINLSGR